MTEIIDLELVDDFVKKPIVKQHKNQTSKPRVKRKGQLTFDDFRNIKIVEEPVVLSHNSSIDESLDAVTHNTNKHEKGEGVDDEDMQTKKLKANIVSKHSNIKIYPNDTNRVELVNENTAINNRPLNTLNWSPNIPLRYSDFASFVSDEKVTENKWEPPLCVPLPYAGDVIKVLSFIIKFKWVFSNDLLNLSFQDVEIGLELAMAGQSVKTIRLCQDKMNFLFCSLLRSLFYSEKGTESQTNKNFTLERFLSLKNPYGKLIGKLRNSIQEWGLPHEWRSGSDILSTLNANGGGLLTIEPLDRIILLRCMIDWNCGYSVLFHNEIQRLTHLKGDTGFSHQTFHANRFAMCGADNISDSCEVLYSLMSQKLENRKKRKPHDKNKLNKINGQMKFLKGVQKSLSEKVTADRLRAAVKINEEWGKHFANELSHTPIDDPRADEIYRLRSSEFMIARIPKFGDFYLPPFRIGSEDSSVNTSYSFNDMATYLDYFIKFKKESTTAPKILPAKTVQKENNCQLKLIYNNTPACVRNLQSSDVPLAKTPHWFEVAGDSNSLIDFIEYLESLSSLDENAADDTKKGIDNLIEFLKIFNIFTNETIRDITDTATESAEGSHLRTSSRKITRVHYSTDVNSDDSEEIESEIESEIEIDVDDNYDSEYLSDENASKGNGGNRTSKSLRENEAYNGSKDRDEDYDDIEIFSEPVRQLQDNSRERRSLRRNARKGLSL
ncbi:Esc8p [Saccharomyces paradoxus]|uniref:Esc8p n=1 Tax=Saccharomyces paradoxus TaxID=27291 RepID=A0A8B8UZE7_SACPA|nr:Esc8 [Saccharomyces paradoxus]QHS76103.1 Esc8 [Saccharomyces paradoxus]